MPVSVINNFNVNQNTAFKRSGFIDNQDIPSWIEPDIYIPKKVSKKVKTGVFLSTLTGVAVSLALLMKGKYSLNPAKIIKTSPKEWGLWKQEYKEKEIIAMAAGSVGGGLLGGAIFDKKENMKAKLRESVIQLFGNVLIPLGCVSLGIKQFKKIEDKITKHINFPKGTSKMTKCINTALKSAPGVVVTLSSLAIGIILGNKTGNFINEEIFKVKDDRKIKAADFSPHIDDLCLAITLSENKNLFTDIVSRIIPAALMVAGISTGVAQEKHDRTQENLNQKK